MKRTLVVGMGLVWAMGVARAAEPAPVQPVPTPVSPPLLVAAAADLAFAFKEVAAAYEKRTGQKTTLTFGSTGLLAKQLEQGAPFDVFAAANVSFVDQVAQAGVCDAKTKAPYAEGRIVLWSSTTSGAAPKDLQGLLEPRVVKIGIANPEHAPYGKAAKEALQKAGVWDKLKGKIVYGENIQQTMQFAQSGNTEVSIVALSLALVAQDGSYTPVDAALHAPLKQALVVCGKDPARSAAALGFARFVNSDEGRAIMKRYGFVLPGEALTAAR